MSDVILQVNHLNIEFHDHERPEKVVSDVNFTLKKGEILGIVGESGSGKSMTALAIDGLLSRKDLEKDGEILFAGENLLTLERNKLRKIQGKDISMIFQEPMTSLNPVKKIGAQVEEGLTIHTDLSAEERKAKALQILKEVELEEDVYDKYPHELSGGMRQRVMIAAAMITDPAILIADEPTTALDVTIQAQIVELLLRLNKEKETAILFISHDLSLVRKLCENVIVMEKGILVEQGNTKQIFENPQEDYTKKLIGAIPKINGKRPTYEDIDSYLIKTEKLNVYYQDYQKGIRSKKQILHEVDFEIDEGEILGLVGESGSGKSTLAKAILKINPNIDGKILYNTEEISMIFQDPYASLNPAKKIGWLLQEPLRISKNKEKLTKEEMKKRAEEMLVRVGLSEEFMERTPKQLSGGQRQRVCIGLALMQNPKLLIADEPVSALDVTIQAQVIELLKKLQKEMQLSILFISHDLRVVYNICDRVMIMKKGQIVEYGSVNEIYENPKEEYTKILLKSADIEAM